jgi:hypothetical protein
MQSEQHLSFLRYHNVGLMLDFKAARVGISNTPGASMPGTTQKGRIPERRIERCQSNLQFGRAK